MKYLVILNDPPYGTEGPYSGIRLAIQEARIPDTDVKLFLMAGSTLCGKTGQPTPQGYYNIERMLKSLVNRQVTEWTAAADKVIVF